jgi:hypothetical protein
VKAFVQLVFQPSYWEKTVHGLDGQFDLDSLPADASATANP